MGNPTEAEIGPIHKAYGSAMFTAQLFEHGLALLLQVISEERKRQGLEPRRVPIDDARRFTTIGIAFKQLKSVQSFSHDEYSVVDAGIKARNLLVHAYWNESRSFALQTPAGRQWLVQDLNAQQRICSQADSVVASYIASYIDKHLHQFGQSFESIAAALLAQHENGNEPPADVFH